MDSNLIMSLDKSSYPSIVIIARTGSSRYPLKVLEKINGKSFIERTIERVTLSKLRDKIILAIPENSENDILSTIALENNILFYRGSQEDVLSRIYNLCLNFRCENIVRINGDCPFIDSKLIDEIVEDHLMGGFDYSSNIIEDSFPIGMHVEAIKFKAIEKAFKLSKLQIEREHVTPYIYNRPSVFKINSITSKVNNSDLRLCIDYPEDLEMAKRVIIETEDNFLEVNELVRIIRNDANLLNLCNRFNKEQSIKY